MKKVFALLLAVMMLATVAMAETVTSDTAEGAEDVVNFDLVAENLPDGYSMEIRTQEGTMIVTFDGGETQPSYTATVAYSDYYEGYTFDIDTLTDEEKADMTELLGDQYNDPEFTLDRTDCGICVIVINENGVENTDYAEVVTVVDGYFISVIITADEVTDEVISNAKQLLDGICVVSAVAEAVQ